MKEKRKLKRIAAKSVRLSVAEGKIDHSKATIAIKKLKSLPKNQAIYVISKYLKGLRRKKVENTAVVESAVPLSKEQLDEVYNKLSKEFVINKIENKVDPNILGGIKVRVGDMILDLSLQNKIDQVGKVIVS